MVLYILAGYMFLFIHRPFEVWPVFQTIHLERIYILFSTVVVVFFSGRSFWPSNLVNLAMVFLVLAFGLSAFASQWPSATMAQFFDFLKYLYFYVLLLIGVKTRQDLKFIVLAYLVVMFIYMSHSLWEYRNGRHTFRMGIVRMVGVDVSMGDPNSFGNSIVYALPFLIPFWRDNPSRRMRAFLISSVGLSGLCIFLTGSRSSFIGLLAFLVPTIYKARRRTLYLSISLLILVSAFFALPGRMQKRFESIIWSDASTAGAKMSAESRTAGFWTGLDLLGKYPISGCGLGAWRNATGTNLESHNLYGELLGETGLVGALAFTFLLAANYTNIRYIRRFHQTHPLGRDDFLHHLAYAVGMNFFLLLLLGWGAHNLIRVNWLWPTAFALIARDCLGRSLRHSAGVGAALSIPR